MPIWNYEGAGIADGRDMRGSIEAENEKRARAALSLSGCVVSSISRATVKSSPPDDALACLRRIENNVSVIRHWVQLIAIVILLPVVLGILYWAIVMIHTLFAEPPAPAAPEHNYFPTRTSGL